MLPRLRWSTSAPRRSTRVLLLEYDDVQNASPDTQQCTRHTAAKHGLITEPQRRSMQKYPYLVNFVT